MKIANTLVVSFISVIFSMIFNSAALGFDHFKDFPQRHVDLSIDGQYFRTESNFSSSGTQEKLPGGNFFQTTDLTLGARYTTNSQTAWLILGNFAAAESRGYTGSRSNTTFNEAQLEVESVFFSERWEWIPELSLVFPTEKSSFTAGDAALTSEGVFEAKPALTLQRYFGSLGGYARTGLTYRAEGRSYLLPWALGAFWRTRDSRWGAEFAGYQSLNEDDATKDKSTRLAYLSKVNGGSYRYASFNPSLVEATLFYHANVRGPWSFELGAGLPLAGTNAAEGYRIGLILKYSFEIDRSSGGYRPQPATSSETPRGRSQMYDQEDATMIKRPAQGFSEDTGDGVDQSLFRSRALTPQKKDPRLQKQLDDVEMQIELKGAKKKKRKR